MGVLQFLLSETRTVKHPSLSIKPDNPALESKGELSKGNLLKKVGLVPLVLIQLIYIIFIEISLLILMKYGCLIYLILPPVLNIRPN